MTADWPTLLTPLLVVLVPAILSQGKRLLGSQTWAIPLIAPALGAALDYVSSLLTQTQVGTTRAALLGLAGVGLREVLDQVRQRATQPMIPPPGKKLVVLALGLGLTLSGCAGLSPDLIRELGKDSAANCVSITTVYGALTMARGTPETSVSVSGGQCTIAGSKTTTGAIVAPAVMVPVQMMVVPAAKP